MSELTFYQTMFWFLVVVDVIEIICRKIGERNA